jgi:hypothetical protein
VADRFKGTPLQVVVMTSRLLFPERQRSNIILDSSLSNSSDRVQSVIQVFYLTEFGGAGSVVHLCGLNS